MRLKCDVKGLNKLQKKLLKAADKSKIRDTVERNTTELQEKAMRKVPVDTGHLQGSIGFTTSKDGMTGTVRAQADYSQYVELGTRYMQAQPYMKPAFDSQKDIFIKDLKKDIIESLK
ncbi:HK97-gp10 family putative phage morphogenesis protein [uncultured Faecalibaculum sp.]|uniref:HK97-gp10 family putative phage morphogenesis protein n=1 Tax=uncultured Faecalibaculum sp. TaxID=1729681 RepID=UPI0025EBC026|nr:HK97-gp10 family putative phage morphogenesis protein [uncultured Faecalibaculum sp.]